MTTPGPSRSTGSDPRHEPVLVAEVVALLQPRADGVYVDGTLGLGGHTAALVACGTPCRRTLSSAMIPSVPSDPTNRCVRS